MINFFITELNTYSDLLTVILTGAVIYLTFRAWRVNVDQLRFLALPIFYPQIVCENDSLYLILENHSEKLARDVRLIIFGEYFEDRVPYRTIIKKEHLKECKIDFKKTKFSDGYDKYAVVDYAEHYIFPPHYKNKTKLDFNERPETISLVLQFKDAAGNNYLSEGWFFEPSNFTEKGSYLLGSFVEGLKPVPRVLGRTLDFDMIKDIFEVTGHIPLPWRYLRLIPMYINSYIDRFKVWVYLSSEVRDNMMRSIPSGFQKKSIRTWIESRGEYSPIKR